MDPRQTAETFDLVQPLLFWLVAGLVAVCAIATVVTQNIVRSATWLLFTLAGTSAIFFLLGADLVGATQLLVYVGGTLVLVVFGVMLTAQGPFISMKASGAEWAISLVAGILLLVVLMTGIIVEGGLEGSLGPDNSAKKPNEPVTKYARALSRSKVQEKAGKPVLFEAAPEVKAPLPALDPATSPQSATLGESFLGVGNGPAHADGRKSSVIRTTYLLPFEIVSVHLLVVLIGAAYLARAKRRRGGDS